MNAEFGQKMTHLAKLNWGIELKFEASPTAPSKKQMSEQDIGIQHEATNSLNNAESGQKDSQLKGFQNFVRKPTTCYYNSRIVQFTVDCRKFLPHICIHTTCTVLPTTTCRLPSASNTGTLYVS